MWQGFRAILPEEFSQVQQREVACEQFSVDYVFAPSTAGLTQKALYPNDTS